MKKLIILFLILASNLAFSQLNINHYIRVGETRIQIGNYVGAIENFNIVIKFKPHLPEPYYFRGLAKHQLEDFRGAIRDYNRAIEIKPYYPDAFMHRGLAFLELKDFTKAISDYNKAIELNPNDANIYNNRGIAKISMKDIEGAIADYDKALQINPKLTNSLINRSNARLINNDIKGAIKDLNQAIIIRPHFANAYLLRGMARLELNDYASALRDFDQTIKLDPKNAYAFTNRGIVKQKLEDHRGAINDYNLALQIDPTIANAYMNRGMAREILKMSGSESDYAIAAKLDPKFTFNAKEVDSSGLAQANQKTNQPPQQNQPQAPNSQGTSAQASTVPNNNSTDNQQDTTQTNEQKKETPEERERRRYKLALADAHNTIGSRDETVDDGRIQNKNIVIDLQPIFILSSYDKYSGDFERTQYYNLELETINNFNNYDPVVTISNIPVDHLREVFRNNILFFNEKIKINSRESQNYLSRGIFFSLIDDYANAMNDLQKAIELNNRNALAYFSRANCELKMIDLIDQLKQNSDAITVPLKNNPSQPGNNIETVTNYKDVLADYSTCLALNPNFAFAYFNQAYVMCKMRDYEGSLSYLNKALEIESDFAEAYFNRGLTKIYLDDVEGGAMDLRKAGELGIQDAYNIIKRYCN